MTTTEKIIKEFLEVLHNKNLKKILDLGCGNGKISLGFAKNGTLVTGVDKKDFLVGNKNFTFINSDIRNFDFNGEYDLIIASLVLHFLEKGKAIELIEKIKENTSVNGYNFLICLSNKDNCFGEKPNNFYPSLEEIEKTYSNWGIIKEKQVLTEIENHGSFQPHRHNILFFIAKKVM